MKQNQMIYKVIRTLLTVVLVAGIFICVKMTGYAESTGTVKSSNVNVRAEANASSTAVATVTTNDVVTILSQTTAADGYTWYNIKTSAGVTGYIRSDFVNKAADAAVDNKTTVTPVDNKTAYVAGTSSVRIRQSASTSADIVATANGGTQLTITGETTAADGYKWYQISFSGNGQNMTGFIRSDLATFTAPTQEPEITEITGTMGEESEEAPTEEAPESSEQTPDTTQENTGIPAAAAGVNELTILNPENPPEVIPAGFSEVVLNLGDREVDAWYRGDFYILYASKADGTTGWFLYDYQNRSYLRCDGLFTTGEDQVNEQPAAGGINYKLITFILVGVVVILGIIIAVLGYKLANIEYEDEDDYDEDDYEEDDEEEVPVKVTRERAVVPTKPAMQRQTVREEKPIKQEKAEKPEKPAKSKPEKKETTEKKSVRKKFIDYFTEEIDDDDYQDDDDDDTQDSGSKEDIDFIDF